MKKVICVFAIVLLLCSAAAGCEKQADNIAEATATVSLSPSSSTDIAASPSASPASTTVPQETVLSTLSTTPKQSLKPTATPIPKNTIGNSAANLINGGSVTEQGDWIYYSYQNDQTNAFGSIWKIKKDGTGETMLYDRAGGALNVIGDWLYFNAREEKTTASKVLFQKMRIDGTGLTTITDAALTYANVIGDWIYYINVVDQKVYKMRTDGSKNTAVTQDSVVRMEPTADWIYYTRKTDNGTDTSVYMIRTDGSDKKVLISKNGSWTVDNGWIYYSEDNGTFKKKINGTQTQKIYNYFGASLSVKDGWLYFCDTNNRLQISKIRTDGTGYTKVGSDYSYNIQVIDGWIYYTPAMKDDFCRIRIDGTGKEIITPVFKSDNAAPTPAPVNTIGNSQGNIVNAGYAAQQGTWIYYRSDDGSLYKVQQGSTAKTKLCSDDVKYINVVGDWVYYQNLKDDGLIYKIRTDGTGRTKVCDGYGSQMVVIGDWIYYQNYIMTDNPDYMEIYGDKYIYRVRTNGTENTCLLKKYISTLCIDRSVIYCTDDNNSLYKMQLNGTQLQELCKKSSMLNINIVGDWIYYCYNNKLYKMRMNGTELTQLNKDNEHVKYLNVTDEWIYYSVDTESLGYNTFPDALYRMHLDGTDKEQIGGGPFAFCVLNNCIVGVEGCSSRKMFMHTIHKSDYHYLG